MESPIGVTLCSSDEFLCICTTGVCESYRGRKGSLNASAEAQVDFTLRNRMNEKLIRIIYDMPQKAAGLMALR